jgi:hypothetical protein
MSRRGPAVRWSDGTFAEDSEEYDEEDGLSEGEVAVFDESEVVDLVRERANAAAKTKGPAPTLGDEALARALASQRSERLSVAQRRLLESDPTDRPAADGAEQSLGMARGQLGQASAGSSREGSASGVGASRKRPARAAEAAETGAAGKRRAPSRAAEPERRRPRDPWVEEEGNGDATGRGWSGDEGAGGSGAGASEETGEEEEEEEEGVDDGEELVAGLTVPRQLWKKLFEHQRTCLEWLWELHQQEVGGILGDEMGLGKTLQMIALWACLQASGRGGPCLVVCPATVLLQWKREVQRWAPEIETVEVLHHSQGGAEPGNRLALLRSVCSDRSPGSASVLVTSYEMVRSHAGQLLSMPWQYVVLDEGHKIRNPHAEITQVCKQFNTPHRLILSGAPIQNKLTELWSLFDFVFPGKLGTLPLFEEHFAIPIAMGTYANASEFKVQTAARCSMVLRDLLRPYLLRRMKADVKLAMPDKSEKVGDGGGRAFCLVLFGRRGRTDCASSALLRLRGRGKGCRFSSAPLSSYPAPASFADPVLHSHSPALQFPDASIPPPCPTPGPLLPADRVPARGVRALPEQLPRGEGAGRRRPRLRRSDHHPQDLQPPAPPHVGRAGQAGSCGRRGGGARLGRDPVRRLATVGQAARASLDAPPVAPAGRPRAHLLPDEADARHCAKVRAGAELHPRPTGREHQRRQQVGDSLSTGLADSPTCRFGCACAAFSLLLPLSLEPFHLHSRDCFAVVCSGDSCNVPAPPLLPLSSGSI